MQGRTDKRLHDVPDSGTVQVDGVGKIVTDRVGPLVHKMVRSQETDEAMSEGGTVKFVEALVGRGPRT